jgi:hypothetical protein
MMYQRILTDPLNFPPDMPSEARSVMTGLLHRDPTRRLGCNGGEEIKRHPFFSKYIDWNRYVKVLVVSVALVLNGDSGCLRRKFSLRSNRASYVKIANWVFNVK